MSFTRPLDAFIVCDRRHLKTFSACETSRSHPPPCLHSEGGNFKKGSRRKTQTGPTGTDYGNLRPFEDHLRCSQPSRWPQNTWAVKTVGELYVFTINSPPERSLAVALSALPHCRLQERARERSVRRGRAGGRAEAAGGPADKSRLGWRRGQAERRTGAGLESGRRAEITAVRAE